MMLIKMIRQKHRLMNRTLFMMVILLLLAIVASFIFAADCRIRKSRRRSSSLHMTRKRGIEIKFSCAGRPLGYYADPDFDCRIFHICDNFGRRIPMRCPPQTMFNQMYRVCDWEYNVDCPDSRSWYHVNSNHYERESVDTSITTLKHSTTTTTPILRNS